MLTSTMKGGIAETQIAAEAVRLGIVVLRPIVEGRRYDLVFDTGSRLLRVQCKWAARKGGVVVVHTRGSRHTPRGYVWSTYDESEIDAVAVYCPDTRHCYYLPIEDVAGLSVVHLRLVAAANHQEISVRYAADYHLGAVAQLGERRAGSAKVRGSSPLSSTGSKRPR